MAKQARDERKQKRKQDAEERRAEAAQAAADPDASPWSTGTCLHTQGRPPFIRGKGPHVLLLQIPVLAHPALQDAL